VERLENADTPDGGEKFERGERGAELANPLGENAAVRQGAKYEMELEGRDSGLV
jgi:hypothetical protein